jgi:DNA-binding transcriptional ArsR family regulator
MQDVFYIQEIDQATALLKPARIELLKRLDEARTCPELATMLGDSAQKIYYHIKALEKVGLVEKVDEKRVRGVVEGYYRAVARSYWLAPQLVGQIGGERMTRDQISLRVLLDLAADIHDDIGKLGRMCHRCRFLHTSTFRKAAVPSFCKKYRTFSRISPVNTVRTTSRSPMNRDFDSCWCVIPKANLSKGRFHG